MAAPLELITSRQAVREAEYPAPDLHQHLLAAHDREQAWRSAGESAIRAEMERRIEAHLLRQRRRRARVQQRFSIHDTISLAELRARVERDSR